MPGLALIRHTPADIAPGVCYGSTDVAALPFGVGLARIVAEMTSWRPARIISSDLRRCTALAEALAVASGAALKIDARLRELDFGKWEGMRWDDAPRDALDRWAADPLGFAAPGGESGAALIARVTAAFADFSPFTGRQAIVSHAGPLRVLMALAGGKAVDLMRPGPALGSVTFFQTDGGRSDSLQVGGARRAVGGRAESNDVAAGIIHRPRDRRSGDDVLFVPIMDSRCE